MKGSVARSVVVMAPATVLVAAVAWWGVASALLTGAPSSVAAAAPASIGALSVRLPGPRSTPAPRVSSPARGVSLVARALGHGLDVSRAPGGAPWRHLSNPYRFGAPLVLLVKREVAHWVEVYLPVRPNGATGWVPAAQVRLAADRYRLVVQLARHRLTVLRDGRAVLRARVGIGSPATPTPTGAFFLTVVMSWTPTAGPYGPYALGLSAHSNVLRHFGTGDGQIAVHGTNEPVSIGQDQSNGCVHVDNATITRLARLLPLGTPIEIAR